VNTRGRKEEPPHLFPLGGAEEKVLTPSGKKEEGGEGMQGKGRRKKKKGADFLYSRGKKNPGGQKRRGSFPYYPVKERGGGSGGIGTRGRRRESYLPFLLFQVVEGEEKSCGRSNAVRGGGKVCSINFFIGKRRKREPAREYSEGGGKETEAPPFISCFEEPL